MRGYKRAKAFNYAQNLLKHLYNPRIIEYLPSYLSFLLKYIDNIFFNENN